MCCWQNFNDYFASLATFVIPIVVTTLALKSFDVCLSKKLSRKNYRSLRQVFRCCCPFFWSLLKKILVKSFPKTAVVFNASRPIDVEAAEYFYNRFQNVFDCESSTSEYGFQFDKPSQSTPKVKLYRGQSGNVQIENFFANITGNPALRKSLLSDPADFDLSCLSGSTNYETPKDIPSPSSFAQTTEIEICTRKIKRANNLSKKVKVPKLPPPPPPSRQTSLPKPSPPSTPPPHLLPRIIIQTGPPLPPKNKKSEQIEMEQILPATENSGK